MEFFAANPRCNWIISTRWFMPWSVSYTLVVFQWTPWHPWIVWICWAWPMMWRWAGVEKGSAPSRETRPFSVWSFTCQSLVNCSGEILPKLSNIRYDVDICGSVLTFCCGHSATACVPKKQYEQHLKLKVDIQGLDGSTYRFGKVKSIDPADIGPVIVSGLDETNCVDVLNHEVLRKYPSFEALLFFGKGWGWLEGLVDPVVGSSRLPLGCTASH